jgi:hypothetical protein
MTKPSSGGTIHSHRGGHYLSAHSTGGNFQTQITNRSHSRPSSCTSQGHSTPMPRRIIQSNLDFSHAPAAPNEITDNNSRSRHNQRAITSEGGHTNDASSVTSEGANTLTKSLSPQLVPRRLLRHGHYPHGHRPWKSTLVPSAPSQCSRSPHHRKRNEIYGPYERPPSTTTLETRFWQRMRAPFSRHSRHSWKRHMFIYQTHKHPERQKYHLRQNSLRLQTTQKRKITSQVDRGRRQA